MPRRSGIDADASRRSARASSRSVPDRARPRTTRGASWIATALAYVPHVARRYQGCGLPFDELLAAGNLGLVEAALRYQPSRNVKFVTYADWWIRKSILKALEDQSGPVRLPRYRQEQLRALRDSRRAWRRASGTEPDSEELARVSGLSRRDVERLGTLGHGAVSLEEPTTPGGGQPLLDVLASEATIGPLDSVIRRDLRRHLRGLVAELMDKERQVVLLRFGFGDLEPMTLREIGRRLGISRERVRQLERRALIKLRNAL